MGGAFNNCLPDDDVGSCDSVVSDVVHAESIIAAIEDLGGLRIICSNSTTDSVLDAR